MSVYLDYNASAPCRAEVVAAMLPYFRDRHGNPSSTHYFGQTARAAVEEARGHVAGLLGAAPEEILFLSGGTEANNMAIHGVLGQREGSLVISAVEHPAIYNTAKRFEKQGREIRIVDVDESGVLNLESFIEALDAGPTAFVSVMTANNETGALQPVAEVARLCRESGVPFHSDAAQAAGKIPVDVDDIGAGYLTVAAHKLGGPIGIGALYIRDGGELDRLLEGGSQEVNRRPGTQAVALAVGFGEACRIAAERLAEEHDRIQKLRDDLERSLTARLPDISINCADAPRLPNTSSIAVPGVSAEMLVIRLDLEGFAVSSGSACSSGRSEPSRTLAAMNLGELATSSIRVSLGPDTTEAETASFVDTMERVVKEIRAPYYEID